MATGTETGPAGINFEESEQVRLLKRQLDEFIRQEVEPLETEYDQFLGEDAERYRVDDDGRLVDDYLAVRNQIQRKSAEAGFYQMHMPEDVGGGGLSILEDIIVTEHIHDRNPDGFHGLMRDTLSVTGAIIPMYYDEFQREKYFEPTMNAEKHMTFGLTEPDHGSDITFMDTVAERDGDEWVINGTKCFISNSTEADYIMVHARTGGEDGDPHGISTFLIDRDNPGWELGKIQRPMGSDVGSHAFNHFTDCRVPAEQMVGDEGAGFTGTAMEWVGAGRLRVAARGVGRSQWMFEQCTDYATQRHSFGKPIGERQFIQEYIAQMATRIEMVRWLTRHAAWGYDRGENPRWEQSAAKWQGANLWNDVADMAIQIHGGAGYMRSLPFEREYRDSRAARIYDGTDEIQKRTIAKEFLNL